MAISFRDAERLWSGLWHKEEQINKKRRWLMQLPLQGTNEVDLKKFKRMRPLSNAFLAESFVRRDEVSCQAIKINIERNHRVLCYTEERLHDSHNYMMLSDMYILQCFLMEPFNLMKFHSTVDLLSNNALGLLANLVTENKMSFERSRSRMKKLIKKHFSNVLSASKDEALMATLQQLYEILRKHENYKENQPSLMTPTCSSTLPSIYKALELLGSMPIFALCALSRKLHGKKLVHRFPPSKIGYNKKELVKRIRRRCEKLIRTMKKENSMPEELVKAISVIHLYFEYKTKCSNTFTTKFFSLSTETVILQKDILNALWSMRKVTSYQMKGLQAILGVKLKDDSSSFLNELKQYLMQYLLECDEIEIPSDVHNVLAILNQSSFSQPQICSKEMIEVETETVLNVSIELNQIVSHLFSCTSTHEKAVEGLESDDDDTNSNDFELVGNDYYSNTVKYQQQQKNDFPITDELETTGDSMPGAYFISSNSEIRRSMDHDFMKKLKKEQDGVDDLRIPHDKKSMETSLQNKQESGNCKDISIQELCDETSLVSYRLIGHMLNSFLLVEGRDVGVVNLTDKRDLLDSSAENVGIKALMHSIKDLLPSIPERCTERVEKLMKQS